MIPAAALLRAAIEQVKAANSDLNENAKTVLSRLLADCEKEDSRDVEGTKQSSRAVEAIARIAGDDEARVPRVVRCCGEFYEVYQAFPEVTARELAMQGRCAAQMTAVDALGEFMREIARKPEHPLIEAYVAIEPHQVESWLLALADMHRAINLRQLVAFETPTRLGMNRKNSQEDAREIAALGYFAEGVERISGRPHYQHVATLAEIVLGIEEFIDPDRVRNALGTRRSRDWRQVPLTDDRNIHA
jgi:hypothetical protein